RVHLPYTLDLLLQVAGVRVHRLQRVARGEHLLGQGLRVDGMIRLAAEEELVGIEAELQTVAGAVARRLRCRERAPAQLAHHRARRAHVPGRRGRAQLEAVPA